jgi:hypothetical protein
MKTLTIISGFIVTASLQAVAAPDTTPVTPTQTEARSQSSLKAMGFKKVGETTLAAENAVEARAQVLDIDKSSREIKLRSQDGEEFSIVASPEVRNFDQIKKGDTLRVSYIETSVIELKKGGGEPVMVTEETRTDRTKEGRKPGAIVTDVVTTTGTITAVDWKKQRITLQGPHRTMILPVEKEVLGKVKKGDQIEARLTQAMAISVESTKK